MAASGQRQPSPSTRIVMSFVRLWISIPVMLAAISNLDAVAPAPGKEQLDRIGYNHPGLTVDLGVWLWAWPLPLDYDEDGDLDLVVVCPDKPYNGAYFFENPGGAKLPVFKPAARIGKGIDNVQLSIV